MSYKSKRSETEIKRNKYEGICLSVQRLDKLKWASLFVTIPLGGNTVTHHHFELSREEVKVMYDWFKEYLKDDRFKPKKTVVKKAKKKISKKGQ